MALTRCAIFMLCEAIIIGGDGHEYAIKPKARRMLGPYPRKGMASVHGANGYKHGLSFIISRYLLQASRKSFTHSGRIPSSSIPCCSFRKP